MKKITKEEKRLRRRARSRTRINGTAHCPRLSVHRSLRGMYVQLIDDENSKTLVSANNKKDIDKKANAGDKKGKEAMAYILGQSLAKKAKDKKIETIVFDRSGYQFHGRVKSLADGMREEGLKF